MFAKHMIVLKYISKQTMTPFPMNQITTKTVATLEHLKQSIESWNTTS